MKAKIKAMRLITGEYIIGNFVAANLFVEDNMASYSVEDALLFEVIHSGTKGEYRIGLQGIVPLATLGETVDFKERDIMFIIEDPHPEILKRYEDATSLIDKA